MNITPGPLAIRTATARERFHNAVIEALRRRCNVRAFTSIRSLIEAAHAPAPQPEARPLLH